jgi:hypothetical protein
MISLDSFFEKKKSTAAKVFGLFFRGKSCTLFNFDKNGLGHILGDFLTNSSSHPAWDRCYDLKFHQNNIDPFVSGTV